MLFWVPPPHIHKEVLYLNEKKKKELIDKEAIKMANGSLASNTTV